MSRRAERRNAPRAPGRFGFRTGGAPRRESDAQLRDRLRDDLLLVGEHPGAYPNLAFAEDRVRRLHATAAEQGDTPAPRNGWEHAERQRRRREDEAAAGLRRGADPYGISLDGMTDRAARYRRELEHGRWELPLDWIADETTRRPHSGSGGAASTTRTARAQESMAVLADAEQLEAEFAAVRADTEAEVSRARQQLAADRGLRGHR